MSQKNGLKKLFSRKLVTEKALLVEINVITIKPLFVARPTDISFLVNICYVYVMFIHVWTTVVVQQSFTEQNTRIFGLSSCVVTTTMKTFYIIHIDVK